MSSPNDRLRNLSLNDEAITYREESINCYSVKSFRASITMVWCLMIYQIYMKIDEFGLSDFVKSVRDKGISVSGNINDYYDLEKIKDTDIISVCRESGFFDDTVKKKLVNLCDSRNSCAHFNRSKINQQSTDAFIADVCDYIEFLQKLDFKFDPNFFYMAKRMDDEGLKHTASSIGLERLKVSVTKILDKIATITNYEEYQENGYLIKFINFVMSQRKEDEILILYDIAFRRVLVSNLPWGWEVESMLMNLTNRSFIQSYIIENGFLDLLVAKLCDSGSFDRASRNSSAVLNFNQYLTPENVISIANAIVENDQIRESWSAKPNVKNILLVHKKLLTLDIVEKLKEKKILE